MPDRDDWRLKELLLELPPPRKIEETPAQRRSRLTQRIQSEPFTITNQAPVISVPWEEQQQPKAPEREYHYTPWEAVKQGLQVVGEAIQPWMTWAEQAGTAGATALFTAPREIPQRARETLKAFQPSKWQQMREEQPYTTLEERYEAAPGGLAKAITREALVFLMLPNGEAIPYDVARLAKAGISLVRKGVSRVPVVREFASSQVGSLDIPGIMKVKKFTQPSTQKAYESLTKLADESGMTVTAVKGIAPNEYWWRVGVPLRPETDAQWNQLMKWYQKTQYTGRPTFNDIASKRFSKGMQEGIPFQTFADAKRFLETGDVSAIAKSIRLKGVETVTPLTVAEQAALARTLEIGKGETPLTQLQAEAKALRQPGAAPMPPVPEPYYGAIRGQPRRGVPPAKYVDEEKYLAELRAKFPEMDITLAPKPVAPTKIESWRMTKTEYIAKELPLKPNQEARMWLGQAHRQAVGKALSEGKPVPLEVLKDYPDLVALAKPTERVSVGLDIGVSYKQASSSAGRRAIATRSSSISKELRELGLDVRPGTTIGTLQVEGLPSAIEGMRPLLQKRRVKLIGEPWPVKPAEAVPPARMAPEAPVKAVEPIVAKAPVVKAVKPPAPPVEPPKPPPLGGPPPTGPTMPPTGAMPEDAVAKLNRLVKEAKPARAETEALKHQEMRVRAARVAQALEMGQGEKAFITAKGALKGELPKAVFEAPLEQLTAQDIQQLNDIIRTSSQRPLTKVSTQEGLVKLLSGAIPQEGELAKLEEIFGSELVRSILAKRALGVKVWEAFLNVVGLPKAVVASVDLSFPLRQGALLVGEKGFWTSWKPMLKGFASEQSTVDIFATIKANPLYGYLEDAKLYQAPFTQVTGKVSAMEEQFMSRLANKIPLVNRSNRAFITFGNKVRADAFYQAVGKWVEQGLIQDQIAVKAEKWARFLNRATGRGSLASLEKMGDLPAVLNAAFFSPRFVMSRFQIPFTLIEKDPVIRKMIVKDLAIFFGAGTTILTLASLAGAKVGLDPRSPEFGKVKIGRTVYDVWAGQQQLARYMTQFIAGERKAITSGNISPVSRTEIAGRFVQSKLSPVAGLIVDALRKSNFIGEPMELTGEVAKREAWNRIVPMFIQDLRDAIAEQGLVGGIMVLPSGLGTGVITYRKTAADFRNEAQDKYTLMDYPEAIKDPILSPYKQLSVKQQDELLANHKDLKQLSDKADADQAKRDANDKSIQADFGKAIDRIEKTYNDNVSLYENSLKRNDTPQSRQQFKDKLNDEKMLRGRDYQTLYADPKYADYISASEARKQTQVESGQMTQDRVDYMRYNAIMNSPDMVALAQQLDMTAYWDARDVAEAQFIADIGEERFKAAKYIQQRKDKDHPYALEYDQDQEKMKAYWELDKEFAEILPVGWKKAWESYQILTDEGEKAMLKAIIPEIFSRWREYRLWWLVKHPEVEGPLLKWDYRQTPARLQLMK